MWLYLRELLLKLEFQHGKALHGCQSLDGLDPILYQIPDCQERRARLGLVYPGLWRKQYITSMEVAVVFRRLLTKLCVVVSQRPW